VSAKAIHEALDYLENNPTADEAQDARRRARKALEAIERAAHTLCRNRVHARLHESVKGEWGEACDVLESIAKEAP
jgi:hypothetical protein